MGGFMQKALKAWIHVFAIKKNNKICFYIQKILAQAQVLLYNTSIKNQW